jgi:hypothetical protein
MARKPDDVGRILGALYPFLISHGHLAEVREWAEAALAARDRLSSRGLAETLVGGGEIARFAGDLSRAIELKEELASVQGDLQRPNWKAATLADLCEIALDQGDFSAARGYAEQSAAAGGGARVALCFGTKNDPLGCTTPRQSRLRTRRGTGDDPRGSCRLRAALRRLTRMDARRAEAARAASPASARGTPGSINSGTADLQAKRAGP